MAIGQTLNLSCAGECSTRAGTLAKELPNFRHVTLQILGPTSGIPLKLKGSTGNGLHEVLMHVTKGSLNKSLVYDPTYGPDSDQYTGTLTTQDLPVYNFPKYAQMLAEVYEGDATHIRVTFKINNVGLEFEISSMGKETW